MPDTLGDVNAWQEEEEANGGYERDDEEYDDDEDEDDDEVRPLPLVIYAYVRAGF